MKIGIDMSSFHKGRTGGREMVALSLLKAFEYYNKTNEITCFCIAEYVDVIKSCGDFKTIVVPYERKWEGDNRIISKIERELVSGVIGTNKVGRFIRNIAIKDKIELVVFTDKSTPTIKFPMCTIFITHDSSYFSQLEIPELEKLSHRYRQILDRWWLKLDMKYRNEAIAISEYDASIIRKYVNKYSNKVKVIYDPIQFGEYIEKRGRKYILALNIRAIHKNVITLIKAFDLIAEKVDLDLILVGEKPYNDEIDRLINNSKYSDRIIFTGFLSLEEINQIKQNTALYVNPSIYEGFGMTAVEMMGDGIETIVADNTAQREVTMGLCNYYNDATNFRELAATIENVLCVPKKEEELISISKQIRKTYDYLHIAQQYYDNFTAFVNMYK